MVKERAGGNVMVAARPPRWSRRDEPADFGEPQNGCRGVATRHYTVKVEGGWLVQNISRSKDPPPGLPVGICAATKHIDALPLPHI